MVASISKVEKVFEALVVRGEQLTAQQIKTRYGVSNPHDAVYQIRQMGYAIYLNDRKNSKGETVNKYRAGKPSRSLVAAGYRALAAGI
jgi:LEA14-like dessication related protein